MIQHSPISFVIYNYAFDHLKWRDLTWWTTKFKWLYKQIYKAMKKKTDDTNKNNNNSGIAIK